LFSFSSSIFPFLFLDSRSHTYTRREKQIVEEETYREREKKRALKRIF
jgi:hypothetical protein